MKARWPWLTSVILAAWEAEIERVSVLGQPNPKKFARPHLNGKKAGRCATGLSSQHWQEA
jgi:hypothetical protein